MKTKFLFASIMLFVVTFAHAQDDKTTPKPTEKTQKEKNIDQSLSNIKKEIENIKNNVDSAKSREIAKTLEKSADEISGELENMADKIGEKADLSEDKMDKSSDEDKSDENEKDTYTKKKEDKKNLKGKFDFKNKKPKEDRRTKTYFDVMSGLNGLSDGNTAEAGRVYPKVNTWSWFWEGDLKLRTRVGGLTSPVSVNYGIGYLRNSYRFENNAFLQYNADNTVKFDTRANASEDPKLIVGYVTIPLGLDVKIGKKGVLGIGAYGGYRVVTRQNLIYKEGSEKVEQTRSDSYGLNNLLYGASVKVGVKGLTFTGKYNLSPLFDSKNTTYKYNTYMFGINWAF
jgi:hypothetical protein